MSRQKGFGLLEGLLALSLGLLLLLGASRLFLAASQSWQAQAAAAQMQEDARLALQRLAQSIRMAGMSGCLRHDAMVFHDPLAAQAFARPVQITRSADGRLQRLGLITAEVAHTSGRPDWTLVTDCLTTASVYAGQQAAQKGQFAIPIRRQEYRLVGHELRLRNAASNGVLVDGVEELQVELVRDGDLNISAVQLGLTMTDPRQRTRAQRYQLNIALGNPVSGP